MRERGERERVRGQVGGRVILAGLGGFLLGSTTVLFVLWLYRSPAVPPSLPPESGEAPPPAEGSPWPQVAPPAAEPGVPQPPAAEPSRPWTGAPAAPVPTTDLLAKHLIVPVQGLRADQLQNTFDDNRGGGRVHEALDIMAPRNTPVLAVEDGRIVKLFTSKQGGLTIYQFDPTERYCYYYAHLERYGEGLREGAPVRKGQVIGYVGTSGNAPKDTPHLHFAVFRLTAEKRWWEGTPIDPYDVLR